MEVTVSMEKIARRIDSYREELIELQKKMTAIQALGPTNGGQGEFEKAEFLKSYLSHLGLDDIVDYDAPDPSVACGFRPNFVARFKGRKEGKTIWVMSHMDIVPEGEDRLWDSKPYVIRVDGDRIYGRGVEDNHQGICSSILAVKALKDEGLLPEYDVALLFVADEETGSNLGIRHILNVDKDVFKKEDLIIIPDGGNEDGSMIEVAEKSIMWTKFTTRGKQTHGSRPGSGINAHKAAAHLIVKLDSLYRKFPASDPVFDPPTSTFEPTKKEANVPNTNTIPGEDIFYMDSRVLPQYQLKDVLAEVDGMCREVEKQFGVTISYEFPQKEQAAPATPVDAPVVNSLKKALKEVYNVEGRAMGIGGGTVAAYIRRIGVPAVVWSRTDETAHQPNEYCKISNILGDAKVFAHLFMQK
jgi:succinyl-diaminopimelate desuccinylase